MTTLVPESSMETSARPVIVVGVSGSRASRAALQWAADEARRRGARLMALRAWQPAQAAYYAFNAGYGDLAQQRAAAACELAASLHEVFGNQPPADLGTEVVAGMPERVLAARSAGADLLVLGSTSAPAVVGRSVGAVIRSCLSRAHCPVVVIGPEGQPRGHQVHESRPEGSDEQLGISPAEAAVHAGV